jgi:hypothetical protein
VRSTRTRKKNIYHQSENDGAVFVLEEELLEPYRCVVGIFSLTQASEELPPEFDNVQVLNLCLATVAESRVTQLALPDEYL